MLQNNCVIQGGNAMKVRCEKCSKLFVDEESLSRHELICPGPALKSHHIRFRPDDLRRLITDFRSAVHRSIDNSLADALERELLCDRPNIIFDTLKQFERWCQTKNPSALGGRYVAEKCSSLSFVTMSDRNEDN